jgi:3-hydroxyisobutyrate dehydrogenase-like beta-hydroxyacid dehydrogenase
MGTPMVLRLLGAGYAVRIWNRSPEKVRRLVEAGASLAETPADAAQGASHVCLCLTDGKAVEDVLFGPSGVVEGLCIPTTIIDFSTIGPKDTKSLAHRIAREAPGVTWVDAPVTGGVEGAETGELVILCGGADTDVALSRPIFSPLSKRVCHLGLLGSGQAAKLCNQLIVSVNVVAIAEALALGRKHGLDLAQLPDALAGGWADSLPLQIIGPRMATATLEPPIVALSTFAKDLDLVLDGAEGLMVAERASSVLREVICEQGDHDATALFSCFEVARPQSEAAPISAKLP